MPVLKVKKDGVWEELGGTSPMDGGNADTLDGKHASEFASASDVADLQTTLTKKADNNHSHSEYAPLYDYGTTDLIAGSSSLTTGKLYFVYE